MSQSSSTGALKTILLAWLVAGTMDITAAVIQTYIMGGQPVRMLRYIASGAFGTDATNGGTPMAIAGLLFHYLNALLFTLFFFFLYPRVSILRKNAIAVGICYGIFVWAVMNLVVVPTSHIGRYPSKVGLALIAMLILIVCIGLPISIIVHRYYEKKR